MSLQVTDTFLGSRFCGLNLLCSKLCSASNLCHHWWMPHWQIGHYFHGNFVRAPNVFWLIFALLGLLHVNKWCDWIAISVNFECSVLGTHHIFPFSCAINPFVDDLYELTDTHYPGVIACMIGVDCVLLHLLPCRRLNLCLLRSCLSQSWLVALVRCIDVPLFWVC